MKNLLADSSYLIALFDERDQFHSLARHSFADYFEPGYNVLLILWPVLFESFGSRMSQFTRVNQIERDWRKLRASQQLRVIDDIDFREDSLHEWFNEIRRPAAQFRRLSLVDRVIRNVLSGNSLQIDTLLTFDPGDFADICRRKRIELAPYET